MPVWAEKEGYLWLSIIKTWFDVHKKMCNKCIWWRMHQECTHAQSDKKSSMLYTKVHRLFLQDFEFSYLEMQAIVEMYLPRKICLTFHHCITYFLNKSTVFFCIQISQHNTAPVERHRYTINNVDRFTRYKLFCTK